MVPVNEDGGAGSPLRAEWIARVGEDRSTIEVTCVDTAGDEGWSLLKRNVSTFIPIVFEGFKTMGRGVLLVEPNLEQVRYISRSSPSTLDVYGEIQEYLDVHRNERMSRLVEAYDPQRDALIAVDYSGKGEFRLYVLAHAITLMGSSDRLQ